MIERIRELLRAREWQPFTIHRVGGDSIYVRTREHVWVTPSGRLVFRNGTWANRGCWSGPDGPDQGALRSGGPATYSLFFVYKPPHSTHQMGNRNVNAPFPENLRDPVHAETATMRLQ